VRKTAVSRIGIGTIGVAVAVALATPAALADSHSPRLYKPSECQRIPLNQYGAVYYCERFEKNSVTYVYPGSPAYLDATYPDPSCPSGERLVAWNGRVVLFTDKVWDYFTRPAAVAAFLAPGGNEVEVSEQMLEPGTPIPLDCL